MKNAKPYKIYAHYNTGTMLLSRHETEQQAIDAYEKALDENQGVKVTIESPENPFEEPLDQE